jgi:prepilin-type processing-associated H-X9-DG protein
MKPGFALAADRGPGVIYQDKAKTIILNNVYATNNTQDSARIQRLANSQNHGREGQNVLFADGHVEFLRTVFVGINQNNIYAPDQPTNGDPNTRSYIDSSVGGAPVLSWPLTGGVGNTSANCHPVTGDDSVILPWDSF